MAHSPHGPECPQAACIKAVFEDAPHPSFSPCMNLQQMYYNEWVNHAWGGMWAGILFITAILTHNSVSGRMDDEAFLAAETWVRASERIAPAYPCLLVHPSTAA